MERYNPYRVAQSTGKTVKFSSYAYYLVLNEVTIEFKQRTQIVKEPSNPKLMELYKKMKVLYFDVTFRDDLDDQN